MKSHFYVVLFSVVLFCMSSCSRYEKERKITDLKLKMQIADRYFDKKDFYRAQPLYEDLMAYYRLANEAEKLYFRSAQCYFGMESYTTAGYYFKTFCENFPKSPLQEESYFMYAFCFYKESLPTKLEQSSTYDAIRELQLFVNLFPESKHMEECNKMLDALRDKLSNKALSNAKLWYQIQDYKAAIVALKIVIHEYPDINNREEIEFLILKSAFYLAKNSVLTKQQERYASVLENYNIFKENYPASSSLKEAESLYNKSIEAINKLKLSQTAINN